MRETKFRGKRLDNGEWVKGCSIVRLGDGVWICEWTGCTIKKSEFFNLFTEVDPATVGQFTGLKDKNGREIYEGSICEVEKTHQNYGKYLQMDDAWSTEKRNYVCCFVDGAFRLRRTYLNKRKEDRFEDGSFKGCEVIGNIHNNPELLKTE